MADGCKDILHEYGLGENEATLYLVLLGLGSTTVSALARHAGIPRPTAYDTLKSLKAKGLVASIVKNKSLHVQALDPQALIDILEERKRKLESAIPQLKALHLVVPQAPIAQLYEGKEGVKSIFQDILHSAKTLDAVSNTHFIFQALPFFVPHFIRQRKERGIRLRLLNERTKESMRLMRAKDAAELRETRFLPELKDVPVTEYIYGEKVAFISSDPGSPLGVIMRHKGFADAQRLLFEALWAKAEK